MAPISHLHGEQYPETLKMDNHEELECGVATTPTAAQHSSTASRHQHKVDAKSAAD